MSTALQRTCSLLRSFMRSEHHIFDCRGSSYQLNSQRRRLLSYSHTAKAATGFASPRQKAPAQPTSISYIPTKEALEDAEIDIDLLPRNEARINVTNAAAEQLKSIAANEANNDLALRISVQSGGCHGYQYSLDLTSDRLPDDYYLTHPSIKPCNIVIDAVSMPLLKGCTLDFATELIGSTFRIIDNPQAKGSGCGCGVSWELKE